MSNPWLLPVAVCWHLFGISLPPAQFDHPPDPNRPLHVSLVDWSKITILCENNRLDSGFRFLACTRGSVIWLPDDRTELWTECALRHEVGHFNGWPASHPNPRS